MTVITHNQRQSRLAKLINRPGGLSVGRALANAKANLESFREQSRSIIEENIEILVAATAADLPETERLEKAYRAGSRIIEAASLFDMEDLCKAAKGLCDIIDASTRTGDFDWRIPPLYGQAMKLILNLPEVATEARAEVLNGLDNLVKRKISAED